MRAEEARLHGYALLVNQFEPEFRQFLANEVLRVGYGRRWLDGIPQGVIQLASERAEKTSFEDPLDLFDQVDFIHLKEVAIHKDNFKFCESFTGNIPKEKFVELMDGLYSLRNKIAHAKRNFSLLDFEVLVSAVRDLSRGPSASSIAEYVRLEKYREFTSIPKGFLEETSVTEIISNLPPEDYDLEGGFVGRKDDKRKLKALLYSDLDRVITLTGSGGVGKTALALNVAYSIREDRKSPFSAIVWFSAKMSKLTPESIVYILPQISSHAELVKKTLLVLRSDNMEFVQSIQHPRDASEYLRGFFEENPVLLVIDNLETVINDAELVEFLKDVPRPSKVLITSRRGLGEVERRFPLKALTTEEACHLFRLVCFDKGLDAYGKMPRSEVVRLVEQVMCYPLALKWALGKAALGKNLEKAFELPLMGSSKIAQFCFEDIFRMMSPEAKLCIYGISLFDDLPSDNVLSYLLEFDEEKFENAIRELFLASLVFPHNDIKEGSVITRYSILSLTRDYVQAKLEEESDIQSMLYSRFQQLTQLVELEEKTTSVRASVLWSIGAKTQEDWIAVAKVRVAKELESVGDVPAALEMYSDAEEISPNLPYVLVSYARMLTRLRRYVEAEQRMVKASEITPSSFHVWYSWGVLKKLQNKVEEAESKLRKAIEIQPRSINALYELGRVLTFRHKFPEAEEVLLNVLEQEMINPRQKTIVLCHIADNYKRWAEGEFEKKNYENWERYSRLAKQYAQDAIRLVPLNRRNQNIYKMVCKEFGFRLLKLQRIDEARSNLLEVLEPVVIQGRKIFTDRKTEALACLYLAGMESVQPNPDSEIVEQYALRGLAVSPDSKISAKLQRLRVQLEEEKNRSLGVITYFNVERRFGLVESEGETHIFFPDCLTWHCDDLYSLRDKRVSFIPVPSPTDNLPDGKKATKIQLILM